MSAPTPVGPTPIGASAPVDPRRQLRAACHELEGFFTRQLLESMRDTVPDDPLTEDDSSGEEMYTALLDDHLASQAGQRSANGLGEALYRQMARRLPVEEGER